MAQKVSEEVLKSFLAHAFHIPDELFAHRGTAASEPRFAISQPSSATLFLVCKRWHRTGLPCLYETILLRTREQAGSLVRTLVAQPWYAKHIRKLRMEGSYNISALVRLNPRITDFCFTLSIRASDNVESLVAALKGFHPERVILTRHEPRSNKKKELVLLTLCRQISAWTNLKRFEFPDLNPHRPQDDNGPAIASALARRDSPTVVVLAQGYTQYARSIRNSGSRIPTVRSLSPSTAIRSIVISDCDVVSPAWKHVFPEDLWPLPDELSVRGFRIRYTPFWEPIMVHTEDDAKFVRDSIDPSSSRFMSGHETVNNLEVACKSRLWMPILQFTAQLYALEIEFGCDVSTFDIRTIGATVGSTLQYLSVAAPEHGDAATFGILRNFKVLKSLTWSCGFEFKPSYRPVELPKLGLLTIRKSVPLSFFEVAAAVQ
ncbi:hypothetical protein AURDEDRAFT_171691 [Auricularia subglabra TFB-10046 SS5]|nr:hypothetical protein AURDEDRAFT_171691 [Auricularia subglabra TFB-10046 SS5]